jgi:D-arabinose 1-dehydrogenase-like Zn-dependent alcohol dehydrogenase
VHACGKSIVCSIPRISDADATVPPSPLQAVIPTNDEEAIKAHANQLDGIIDTVAAKHDYTPLFTMLKAKVRQQGLAIRRQRAVCRG